MRTARACWDALGTSVALKVTEPAGLVAARAAVAAELERVDDACSRFRADSELARVNANAGRAVPIGPHLAEALELALRAAWLTDGDVDPALGSALVLAGYDRDFRELSRAPAAGARAEAARARPTAPRAVVRPAWRAIELDRARSTVRVPPGAALDLGASAKAWAADRAAREARAAAGCGVLVSLGGDIALAGDAPPSGWRVHVTEDHRAGAGAPGQTVALYDGGLATSSTTVRRWRHRGREMHHVLDPRDGQPVAGPWRTVTVAAATCADANIAATAALVRGAHALEWLHRAGLPARLVGGNGRVVTVCGWPAEERVGAQPELGRAA